MKKLIAIAAVGLISTSAMASNARLAVMGNGLGGFGGSNGSFYYNDNYNIFYNPAYVNDFTNWVAIERTGGVAGEPFFGGVTGFGAMNVGLFLNRAGAYTTDNRINVMVGGDSGVKWGVGLEFGNQNGSELDLTAGVSVSDFDPFINFKVMNEDAAEVEHPAFGVGLRYHWGDWTPYALFDIENEILSAGIGRSSKLKEGVMLNYALAFTDITNNLAVPLQVAVEADVNSWLVFRAGLGYGFGANQAANARLGGTFKMAGANLDFAVGGGNGGGDLDADTFGFSDELFTTVGLTYNW